MKVIVVWFAARRLMKYPGGSNHCLGRMLVTRGVAEKPDLEIVRAEEPFNPGFVVHHQAAHQVPIARFVEAERLARQDRDPKPVELKPGIATRGEPAGVAHEKQKVGVPAGSMGAMPRVRATMVARQIADPKWVSRCKSVGYFTRRALDRTNERLCPVLRPVLGPQPTIPLSPVGEANGMVQVAVIGSADRDRLARRQWLGHTGTDHHDSRNRENPQHFKCMIAYGST
ncbi:MAG: hypothetical protein WBB42_08090 [Polyangiales bacterium]